MNRIWRVGEAGSLGKRSYRRASLIRRRERQDQPYIGRGVVVPVNRGAQLVRIRQIGAARTQVATCRQRGVVHVVRVGDLVRVPVGSDETPGAGQELHRTDRPIEHGLLIESAGVGVEDPCRIRGTVQYRAKDRRRHIPIAAGSRPGVDPVVRLHIPDRGQKRPLHVTRGGSLAHELGGVAISAQHDHGDTGRSDHRRYLTRSVAITPNFVTLRPSQEPLGRVRGAGSGTSEGMDLGLRYRANRFVSMTGCEGRQEYGRYAEERAPQKRRHGLEPCEPATPAPEDPACPLRPMRTNTAQPAPCVP